MNNIYIIAGTFEEFRLFRKQLCFVMADEGMSFKHSDFIYVRGPETFLGTNNPWGYKVGQWYKREDIMLINQAIRERRSDPAWDFIPVEL